MLMLLNDTYDTGHIILGTAIQFKIKEIFEFMKLIKAIDTTDYLIREQLEKEIRTNNELPTNIVEMYEEIIKQEVNFLTMMQLVHFEDFEDEILLSRYNLCVELFDKTFPDINKNVQKAIEIAEKQKDKGEFSILKGKELNIFDVIGDSVEFNVICDFVRELNGWFYKKPHPNKILRKREELSAKIDAKSMPDVNLDSMWSTVAVETGYTPDVINKLTLKQFFELYGRVSKFKGFDASIISAAFGGKIYYYNSILEQQGDNNSMGIELTRDEINNLNRGKDSGNSQMINKIV